MAQSKEPEDTTLRLLREIRANQNEQSEFLKDVATRLDHVEKRLDELVEGMTYSLGLSLTASRKADAVDHKLMELERRITRLERSDNLRKFCREEFFAGSRLCTPAYAVAWPGYARCLSFPGRVTAKPERRSGNQEKLFLAK